MCFICRRFLNSLLVRCQSVRLLFIRCRSWSTVSVIVHCFTFFGRRFIAVFAVLCWLPRTGKFVQASCMFGRCFATFSNPPRAAQIDRRSLQFPSTVTYPSLHPLTSHSCCIHTVGCFSIYFQQSLHKFSISLCLPDVIAFGTLVVLSTPWRW